MNIKLYYHVCPHPDWENFINIKIQKMKDCALWDRFDKIVFCTHWDERNFENFKQQFESDSRVRFVHHHESVKPFDEQYTNQTIKLETDADPEPSYIFRLHMKGITAWPKDDDYSHNVLDLHNILRWREVVEKLDQGYETTGVWWVKQPRPHYMGNVWWATSEYIKRLQLLKMPHEVGGRQQLPSLPGNPNVIWSIHDAEMWVGTAEPKAYDMLRETDIIADHPAAWVHQGFGAKASTT